MSRIEIARGDIVIATISGDYGKPRPALVIQSDAYENLPSVTLLPLSSHIIPAPLYRLTIHPDSANQLPDVSQIMVDKAVTVPRAKVGQRVGQLDSATLTAVDEALRNFFEL